MRHPAAALAMEHRPAALTTVHLPATLSMELLLGGPPASHTHGRPTTATTPWIPTSRTHGRQTARNPSHVEAAVPRLRHDHARIILSHPRPQAMRLMRTAGTLTSMATTTVVSTKGAPRACRSREGRSGTQGSGGTWLELEDVDRMEVGWVVRYGDPSL